MNDKNLDDLTVRSFGDEWSRFDQKGMSDDEASHIFNEYFAVFPWERLPDNAVGFDMGCGSGRWAKFVSPRVGHLHCVDPSDAIEVAKAMLDHCENVSFHRKAVGEEALPPDSQDFGYSLGVLHHIPDTGAGLKSCVAMLKRGAPFLVYLYYAFDNRPFPFRIAWRISDLIRRVVCRLPPILKHAITDLLAALVYFPLAMLARLLERFGANVSVLPLSYYRNHSFYTMRTDSRDRFGTPLERRFTQAQISMMMQDAGLIDIRFSQAAPFWCAVGIKA